MKSKHLHAKTEIETLDGFIDAYPTKGPRAIPGPTEYNYQDWHNMMNYFIWLRSNDERFADICIPKNYVRYRGWKYFAAILMTYDDQRYRTSRQFGKIGQPGKNGQSMDHQMCAISHPSSPSPSSPSSPKNEQNGPNEPNRGPRFVILSVMIFRRWGDLGGHQNVLIVDLSKKTVERFEPHGQYTFFDDVLQTDYRSGTQVSEWIDRTITSIVKQTFPPEFTYRPPASYMRNRKGIQLKGDLYDGMCITWCMIYIHLRIRNPKKSPASVYRYLYGKTNEELQDLCARYARRVERVLKRHKIKYEVSL